MMKFSFSKSKKYTAICPKCHSVDVSTNFSDPGLAGTGLFNNAKVCNKCGYKAHFFPEIELEKKPAVKKKSGVKKTAPTKRKIFS